MGKAASILPDENAHRNVIRGLSALFWGLPLALLFSFKTGTDLLVSPAEALTPTLAFALIYFGCSRLKALRLPGDYPISHADWVNLLALTNVGLSPFLYFWNQNPEQHYFSQIVVVLHYTCLLFVYSYNRLLAELSKQVQEDPLYSETQLFASLNTYCLLVFAVASALYLGLHRGALEILRAGGLGPPLLELGRTLLLFLILLPLALTMTTTWRLKELFFDSRFHSCKTSTPSD